MSEKTAKQGQITKQIQLQEKQIILTKERLLVLFDKLDQVLIEQQNPETPDNDKENEKLVQ